MITKKLFLAIALIIVLALPAVSQSNSMQQLLEDSTKQNEVVAAIGHNHALIMKIIDELAQRPHFVEMMKERFKDTPSKQSQYVGEESRSIKSLSDEQITQYLSGEGMGLAKAAELNGYPGPKHVLDLSKELQLGKDAKQRIQSSYDEMHKNAVSIGKQIVEMERHLDTLFASKSVSRSTIMKSVSEITKLQGLLRIAHLFAHLETSSILSEEQIKQYIKLRGYDGNSPINHEHH